jgi:hypothetical protein
MSAPAKRTSPVAVKPFRKTLPLAARPSAMRAYPLSFWKVPPAQVSCPPMSAPNRRTAPVALALDHYYPRRLVGYS